MTTDLRPLHRRALAAATPVLDGVRAADLAAPTPCAGWDLLALLGHVIGQNHGFAAAVEAPDAPVSAFADRPPAPDGTAAAWAASAARLTAAFDAADLDRRVLLAELSSENRFPVATVVGFHLLDTVVHAWDVATALDIPFRPDDELVAATLTVAKAVPTGATRQRPGATFAPVLPDDGTDDWRHALALLGRRAA